MFPARYFKSFPLQPLFFFFEVYLRQTNARPQTRKCEHTYPRTHMYIMSTSASTHARAHNQSQSRAHTLQQTRYDQSRLRGKFTGLKEPEGKLQLCILGEPRRSWQGNLARSAGTTNVNPPPKRTVLPARQSCGQVPVTVLDGPGA